MTSSDHRPPRHPRTVPAAPVAPRRHRGRGAALWVVAGLVVMVAIGAGVDLGRLAAAGDGGAVGMLALLAVATWISTRSLLARTPWGRRRGLRAAVCLSSRCLEEPSDDIDPASAEEVRSTP